MKKMTNEQKTRYMTDLQMVLLSYGAYQAKLAAGGPRTKVPDQLKSMVAQFVDRHREYAKLEKIAKDLDFTKGYLYKVAAAGREIGKRPIAPDMSHVLDAPSVLKHQYLGEGALMPTAAGIAGIAIGRADGGPTLSLTFNLDDSDELLRFDDMYLRMQKFGVRIALEACAGVVSSITDSGRKRP